MGYLVKRKNTQIKHNDQIINELWINKLNTSINTVTEYKIRYG